MPHRHLGKVMTHAVAMGDRHPGRAEVAFSSASFTSAFHEDGLCFQTALWAMRVGGLRRERMICYMGLANLISN